MNSINGACGKNVTFNCIKRMNFVLTRQHMSTSQRCIAVSKECVFGYTHFNERSNQSLQLTLNRDVSIILLGKIYNYSLLKKQIQNTNQFQSRRDILISLYLKYGPNMLEYIDGEYAMVLYDHKQKLLLLSGDHLGIKPLYYYLNNGLLIFSSRINGILAYGRIPKELDTQALYHMFTLGACIDNTTLYNKILKIEPGTYITYQRGVFQKHLFHSWNIDQKRLLNPITAIQSLLVTSVKARCSDKNTVGFSLSGGIDSSLVGYFAKQKCNDIKSISLTHFEQRSFNNKKEIQYQTIANKTINSQNISLKVQPSELRDIIRNVIEQMDDFAFHPSIFSQYFIYRTASQNNIDYMLSGDGADELFLGYDYHLFLSDMIRKKNILSFIRNFEVFFRVGTLSSIRRNILQGEHMFFSNHFYFDETHKQSLFLSSFSKDKPSTESLITRQLESYKDLEPLNQFIIGELLFKMRQSLTIIDRMSSYFHIENRFPFLQKNLIYTALSISTKEKVKNNTTKYILKKIAGSFFNSRFVNRRKTGLTFPTRKLFTNKPLIKKILSSEIIQNKDIFSKNQIASMLHDYITNPNESYENEHLSTFLIFFFIWYDFHFAEGALLNLIEK